MGLAPDLCKLNLFILVLVLSSSQFLTGPAASKKVVKMDPKIIIWLCYFKSVTLCSLSKFVLGSFGREAVEAALYL